MYWNFHIIPPNPRVSEELFSDRFVPDAIEVEDVPVGQDIALSVFPPPPLNIAFDAAGQRVFTATSGSDSVSIVDLANNANTVTNVPLTPSGGEGPISIAFDAAGGRVFTANGGSNSVSIITNLTNPIPTVTNVPLAPFGGVAPVAIAFDAAGQRVFTANIFSDSVSIISGFPTVAKICQDSGFDTGDIRTFVSGQQTLEQITCVNFVGECTGNIDNGETRECTVQDYIVNINEISNGDGIGILGNTNESQQKLSTNSISNTENNIKTSSVPTGHFM